VDALNKSGDKAMIQGPRGRLSNPHWGVYRGGVYREGG